MDLYAHYIKVEKSREQLVVVGRVTSLSAIIIAAIVAQPLLGKFDQAFQYIQEFTGFFTPGVVAIFLLAIFWKKATANGAIAAAIASVVLSLGAKVAMPTVPFMDRVGIVFVACLLIGVVVSRFGGAENQPGAIEYRDIDTSTSRGFGLASLTIVLMLTGLYVVWW